MAKLAKIVVFSLAAASWLPAAAESFILMTPISSRVQVGKVVELRRNVDDNCTYHGDLSFEKPSFSPSAFGKLTQKVYELNGLPKYKEPRITIWRKQCGDTVSQIDVSIPLDPNHTHMLASGHLHPGYEVGDVLIVPGDNAQRGK